MIKILIADDEPLVQIGIKSMINWEEYGIEVCGTAMNGANALDLIEEYSPEIVITDIRMPHMDGIEMMTELRRRGCRAHVILLTLQRPAVKNTEEFLSSSF